MNFLKTKTCPVCRDSKRVKSLFYFTRIFICLIIFGGVFGVAEKSRAAWQEDLEGQFDIAETFDELQDWKGTSPSNAVDIQTYPNDFPKKLDGSPSIWQYYSDWDTNAGGNWIQDHGTSNVWRGQGKSAAIDYANGIDGIQYGPSRLGFKIGDSPDDGYDEVHLFFMTKWDTNFFKHLSDGSFSYHRFLKTLDISAGFKTVRHWGTDAEYNWVQSNGGVTQVLNEYGLNAQVYNYSSYGGALDRREIIDNTYLTTSANNYHYMSEVTQYTNAIVGTQILNSEWFGIEYRVKKSSPAGATNGEFEIWIYDENGNEIAHQIQTGAVNFKDGNTPFDHKWNKFIWGGNRFAGAYCPSDDPLCDFGPVDHFYIDDVIVDNTEIGPAYFILLSGTSDTTAPSSPSGLSVL